MVVVQSLKKSRLTATFIKTAGTGKHHDGGGAGLIFKVSKNGRRGWVQRIVINGKRREIGLGSYPIVSLAEARQTALENKQYVYAGKDPIAERRKDESVLTFAEAIPIYLKVKLDEFRNEKHKKQWSSSLNTYAVPVLGEMPLNSITVRDVLRVLQPIWTTKTETASRVRGRIESILTWAKVSGYREGPNPADWRGNLSELLPKPSKIKGRMHQPAIGQDDIVRWWKSLEPQTGMAALALKFLTMTAARSGEVRGATWDEIELSQDQQGVWNIPASRMKNSRPHRVPLSYDAASLLRCLPRMDGSPYIFFAARGGMLSDMALSAVMRRMHATNKKAGGVGFIDPQNKRPAVPHGIRSSFRQWAAENGYPRDMAEMALAHFIGSEVERAYQRSDMLERRRSMMTEWAQFLGGKSGQVDKLNRGIGA